MHASCVWPDVDPDQLHILLADPTRYGELVYAIQSSVIVRREGGRTLVHQVQTAKGIAPREVMVWMSTERVDDATKYSWATAIDEPLIVAKGSVRSPRNEGYWLVGPAVGGGTQVDHHVAYNPGGSVPGWLVRWASVGGLSEVMAQVHATARSQSVP